MPNVSYYRKRVIFKDPYENITIKPIITIIKDTVKTKAQHSSNIRFDIPPGIDRLLQRHSQPTGEAMGFRIHLYSGNQSGASAIQFDFQEQFPDVEVTVIYDKPNFKVRAGNFTRRSEADKFFKQLKERYPSAFVVPDRITIKR